MTKSQGISELSSVGRGLSNMAKALSQAKSRREAFDSLAIFLRGQNLPDVILSIESSGLPAQLGEMRWSTLDHDHLAGLLALGFDGHDPIRRFARRSIDPFVWTASDWPGLSSRTGRDIMNGLRKMSIHAGMTAAVWGRASRVAVVDAFGDPEHLQAMSPWMRESFHLAATMTFRAIERLSLVRGGAILSKREVEIIDLVSQGLAIRSIARRLEIVEPTVKFHLKSVRTKLNARNTSEAVARFAALDFSGGLLAFGSGERSSGEFARTAPSMAQSP